MSRRVISGSEIRTADGDRGHEGRFVRRHEWDSTRGENVTWYDGPYDTREAAERAARRA